MSKYIFVKERDKNNHFDNTTVLIEVDTESRDDILQAFEEFLKGSGFSFKGSVEIVDEEEYQSVGGA